MKKRMSDAARIRKVLSTYGCTLEAKEVKRLCCTPGVVGPVVAKRFKSDPSLSVKIAQEQGKMIRETTGVARKGKGRMSKTERELVAAKARITELERQIADHAAAHAEQVREAHAIQPDHSAENAFHDC